MRGMGFEFNYEGSCGTKLTLTGHTTGILEIESLDDDRDQPDDQKLGLGWDEVEVLYAMLGQAMALQARMKETRRDA